MTERIVVLRPHDPFSFVADGCAALAAAVNEPHAWTTSHDQLVIAYAAMVRAYAGLMRPTIESGARCQIVDHLLERLSQAELGEIVTPVLDIVDRLHGELTLEPALH